VAQTRDQIQAQYDADMREANAYKETDPGRTSELSIAAERRRADSLDELGRSSDLERARAQAQTEFPDADPRAITGANIEEIRANAKASHEYVQERVNKGIEETRKGSRANVAERWGPNGQPAVPRSEVLGSGLTADRTNAQIDKEMKEAIARGDTGTVLKLKREQGGMSGMDRMAETAVARAREERSEEQGGGGRQPTQQEIEDRRG
jgi:hypothetical protein